MKAIVGIQHVHSAIKGHEFKKRNLALDPLHGGGNHITNPLPCAFTEHMFYIYENLEAGLFLTHEIAAYPTAVGIHR